MMQICVKHRAGQVWSSGLRTLAASGERSLVVCIGREHLLD